MFKFDKDVWKANRGTGGRITLKAKEGQSFNYDDEVKLNVYSKKQLELEPVVSKLATISEDGSEAVIEISNDDMEFDPIVNKMVEYWYEVKVNGATIIGYDENGAKILELYPEGCED